MTIEVTHQYYWAKLSFVLVMFIFLSDILEKEIN